MPRARYAYASSGTLSHRKSSTPAQPSGGDSGSGSGSGMGSFVIGILGSIASGLAIYYVTRAITTPATPAASSSPAMTVTQGQSYSFVVAAPSDPTSWLQSLGATVTGTLQQAVSGGVLTWSGTFTWTKASGALPVPAGGQWVTVTPTTAGASSFVGT